MEFSEKTFQEYAMEKLAVMYTLQLSEKDSIHLLINGISSLALRSTAASLRADTIDQFLEDMYNVTSVSPGPDKRGGASTEKTGKAKDFPCKTCGKNGRAKVRTFACTAELRVIFAQIASN